MINSRDTLLFTAGGNFIRVWDIVENGKMIQEIKYHQKTITSLALTKDETKLLSGGLEQIVQVVDMKNYKLLYTISCPGPVLSVSLGVYFCFIILLAFGFIVSYWA